MYARSTTIRGNPSAAVDEGIAYLREKVLPVVQEMKGSVGLSALLQRATGLSILTSAWEDEEAMRASAERMDPMRERLVQLFGAEPEVQEWEIAVLHRAHTAGDEAWARVTWGQVQPGRLDRFLDSWRTSLMPTLQELPGYSSLSMLVDRDRSRTVSTISFDSRDALEATRDRHRARREELARATGTQAVDVQEMELVIHHLRVPATV
jgi:heme-degrading monooxygenase HmoA